jgi:nicotinamidase-related amidase
MYAILSAMHGDETDRTYERAGWGERTPRGTRPAVLVVDLSRGFTEPGFPTGADLTDTVAATTELIGAARAGGAPVLFTTIAYEAADVEGACGWLRKAPGLGILRAGTELADLDPRLPRDPARDPLIVKKGASAFFGTDLAAQLVALRVDTVLVCGATTSGCVRASVVDAVQYGFTVLVPRDCVGDRAAGPHDANLFDIDAKYGDVIDQQDALAYTRDPTARGAVAR